MKRKTDKIRSVTTLFYCKPCIQIFSILAKDQRSLTPHIAQCKFIKCHQTLTEALLTLL